MYTRYVANVVSTRRPLLPPRYRSPQLVHALLVYEEAVDPVGAQAPQHVVLSADEDCVAEALVVRRLLDLSPRLGSQRQPVLVLNISATNICRLVMI